MSTRSPLDFSGLLETMWRFARSLYLPTTEAPMTTQSDTDREKQLAELRQLRADLTKRLAEIEAAIERRKQNGDPCPTCGGTGEVWEGDCLMPCPDCVDLNEVA